MVSDIYAKKLKKKELRKLSKLFPKIPRFPKERYSKGDIVTYSNGVVKSINKPNRYYWYFDSDYYNPSYDLQIIKIQRPTRLFGNIYRLKTVYERHN